MIRSCLRRVILLLSLCFLTASLFAGVVQAQASIDGEARAIAQDLQCPICGGQSVADSNSQLAGDMRDIIRKKLAQGESREAILSYLVDRYGEVILREPSRSGFNQLLWLLPSASIAVGAALLGYFVYRWQGRRKQVAAQASPSIGAELAAFEGEFEAEIRERTW